MQDECSNGLRQQSRNEWRNSTAHTSKCADSANTAQRLSPGHGAHEDGRRAWVDGTEEEANKGDGDGVAYNVGNPPHENLERDGAEDEAVYKEFFANLLGRSG